MTTAPANVAFDPVRATVVVSDVVVNVTSSSPAPASKTIAYPPAA